MSTYGAWIAYVSGDNLAPNQPETIIDNLRLWNIWSAGVDAYHTSHLTLDHLLILGDQAAQDRPDEGSLGVLLLKYENRDLVIRNAHIEGVRNGILAPQNDASQAGVEEPTIIENSVLKNYINIAVFPALDNRPGNGNSLIVRNVLFGLNRNLPGNPAPGTYDPPANIQMQFATQNEDVPNLTQLSVVRVYSYNQIPGDDFQVYYRQQLSTFVVPKTVDAALSGGENDLIGAPQAGLTNYQTYSQFKIAVAGRPAPLSATTRADINGLVSALPAASAVTPRVVLVTPWDGAVIGGTPPLRIRYNVIGSLPAGSKVYFTLDSGAPFSNFNDGGLYVVSKGAHRLQAYIGDVNGHLLAGTILADSTFTLTADFGVIPPPLPPPAPLQILGGAITWGTSYGAPPPPAAPPAPASQPQTQPQPSAPAASSPSITTWTLSDPQDVFGGFPDLSSLSEALLQMLALNALNTPH